MALRDIIKINNPTAETRSAFGVTRTTETIETRGLKKNINPKGAALYQSQGYDSVEFEVIIRCQGSFPDETVKFAGNVDITDSRTGTERNYDVASPAIRRGDFIVFGVRKSVSS